MDVGQTDGLSGFNDWEAALTLYIGSGQESKRRGEERIQFDFRLIIQDEYCCGC